MEEEVSHIEWSAVWSVLKKRWVWIVCATLAVTLLAGLLTAFVFNDGKDVYTLSFDLSCPSGTEVLPDGRAFSAQSLVYAENLQNVKDGNEAFASLDIAALSAGGLTLTDNAAADNTQGAAGARWTLTAKESDFSSYEQANAFMFAVAESFVALVTESLEERDETAWEEDLARASDYDEYISVLQGQYRAVLAEYDALIATRAYADHKTDGLTVAQHRARAAGNAEARLAALQNEQNIYAYVLGDTDHAVLVQARELEKERDVNADKISALQEALAQLLEKYAQAGLSASQMDTFESFHADIAALTQRNVELESRIEKLYTSIGYEKSGAEWIKGEGQLLAAPAAFTGELQALRAEIGSATQILTGVRKDVYARFTRAETAQAQAQVTAGGANVYLISAAAAVIAAGVACMLFALAGYRKQLLEEESLAAGTEKEKKQTSQEKEAAAQAAADIAEKGGEKPL